MFGIFSRSRAKARRASSQGFAVAPPTALAVEVLEQRLVPYATIGNPPPAYFDQGQIHIESYSSTQGDNVTVFQSNGDIVVNINNKVFTFRQDQLYAGNIIYQGTGGNDFFQNLTNLRVEAYGKAGSDTIFGGGGNDYIDGGAGYDAIDGGLGNDLLLAGYDSTGNKLLGNDGNDTLYGSNGPDVLDGGLGNDYIDGGLGGDQLLGQGGNDVLVAGGDSAHNVLWGSVGDDTLMGANGNDDLFGDEGNDLLQGLAGNDKLYGGSGYDILHGGEGADYLDGGQDGVADYLNGGAGNDIFRAEKVYYGNSIWQWSNRDQPVDFSAGDSYYQEAVYYYSF